MKLFASRNNYNSDIPLLSKFEGKDEWILCIISDFDPSSNLCTRIKVWTKIEASSPYDFYCIFIPYHPHDVITEEDINNELNRYRIRKTYIHIIKPMEIVTTEDLISPDGLGDRSDEL